MGMMTGTGPLSPHPAGQFNFTPPPPGWALYLEPTPKRIRALLGDETVADSRRALLLHESGLMPVYYFPPEDVRTDLLTPSPKRTRCPKKGEASYYSVSVGRREVADAAWSYPHPLEDAPPIRDLIAFYWDRVDRWLEEDEEVLGHPRDPYHRIDTRRSSRRVRVSLDGQTLAQSTRPVALFESNLPVRWYLPPEDVSAQLEPSATTSICPYKGRASYHSVRLAGGRVVEDLIWYYPDPLPEAAAVAGLLCFYNERVDLELDGQLQEQPGR
jgi:uncharacterized protein (DUF427 family)